MSLLSKIFGRTCEQREFFISYSTNEEDLAEHLSQWLKGKLNMSGFCGALPEAVDAGTDWYKRITEAAGKSDECLLLLSPDSLRKDWIHFEAGLALGASIQKASPSHLTAPSLAEKEKNIIPLLYGGLQMRDVPSNLSRFQCLDLMNKVKFDAFAQRINQGSVLCAGFHDDFMKTMSTTVRHQLLHGGSSLIQAGEEVRTEAIPSQTFDHEGQSLPLNRINNHESLVAVRLRFVPRTVGDIQKWKFGIELKNPNFAGPRAFQFHAGCHDGENTWSLYSRNGQIVPISIPADFNMDVPASIQLWLSKDGRFASCIGIDSDDQRQVLLNRQREKRWRLDDINWTTAIIAGWADGSKYRVDIDHAEVDWVKMK